MSSDDSVIFVGNKPFMNYVTAAVLQFNGGAKQVVFKARGKHISRCVDVVEVIKNKFLSDVKVDKIDIGSEEVENKEGRKLNVSTIEITVSKG